MMRFASLGSGSEGNGLIVHAGNTHLMLDCGFGLADTTRRLGRLALTPGQLNAIVVTHEHDDHVGGVARFARKRVDGGSMQLASRFRASGRYA